MKYLIALLLLTGCATTPRVPAEVKVPVPVPCEIAKVDKTELPVAAPDAGIYERAQVAAARILLLMAENDRLHAANNTPCAVPATPNA